MACAIWTGVLSCGLGSVPVGLFSATEQHEEEFQGAPGRSRALEVHAFVDRDELDPIPFERTYYLAPTAEGSRRTYALLRDTMAAQNRAAIATFAMRDREYLAAIRVDGDILVLEAVSFPDGVPDPHEALQMPPDADRTDPPDSYIDRVRALVGTERSEPQPDPSGAPRPRGRRRRVSDPDRPPKEMTLTELRDVAKHLGVRGRSSMTRLQLADAVRKARRRVS